MWLKRLIVSLKPSVDQADMWKLTDSCKPWTRMTHPYLVLSNAHTYARTLPLTAACEQAVTRTSCTDREGLTRRLAQRHANKRASETHAQLYTRSLAHPHARARGRELAFVHAHTRQAHANLGVQKAYTCFFFFFLFDMFMYIDLFGHCWPYSPLPCLVS